MKARLLATLMVASGLIGAAWLLPAFAAAPTQVQQSGIGPVLADLQGQTLYTYDENAQGKSACDEQCAEE